MSKESMIKTLLQLVRNRFVGFSLVGLGVMVGGIILLYVLVSLCGIDKNIAYLLQAFASVESSFILNRWLNWNDRTGNVWMQLVKFNVTRLGIVVLNQLIFVLLVSWGLHYLLVAIIGVAVATIINYFINDWFVFTGRKLPEKEPSSTWPGRGEDLSLSGNTSGNYGFRHSPLLARESKEPV